MEKKVVTYGCKGIQAFPITGFDENGLPIYDTKPTPWPGARGVTMTPSGDNQGVYADDKLWMTLAGAEGSTGNITAYTLPRDVKINLLGYVEDKNKALVVGNKGKSFGFCYEVTKSYDDGTTDQELHIIYNATVGTPEEEDVTKEDTITPKEYSVPYTAGAINVDGFEQAFSKVIIDKSVVGDEVYNKAKESMYIPEKADTPK